MWKAGSLLSTSDCLELMPRYVWLFLQTSWSRCDLHILLGTLLREGNHFDHLGQCKIANCCDFVQLSWNKRSKDLLLNGFQIGSLCSLAPQAAQLWWVSSANTTLRWSFSIQKFTTKNYGSGVITFIALIWFLSGGEDQGVGQWKSTSFALLMYSFLLMSLLSRLFI